MEKYRKLERALSWRINFYLNVFLSSVSYSIVLPSLWPYLKTFGVDSTFLALVMSLYSVGEFAGALVGGYFFNRFSMKCALTFPMAVGCFGCLAYFLAFNFENGHYLILAGRVLQGFWLGAQQASEQAYVSECINKDKILILVSELGSIGVLGFIAGPVLGYLTSLSNFSIGVLFVNQFTGVGFFQTIFGLIMFFTTLFTFQEIPRNFRRVHLQREKQRRNEQAEQYFNGTVSRTNMNERGTSTGENSPSIQARNVHIQNLNASEKKLLAATAPNLKGVAMSLFVFLVHYNGLAVQETVATPLITDLKHVFTETLGFTEQFAFFLYAVAGVIVLATFVLLIKFGHVLNDTALVFSSLVGGFVSYILIIDFVPKQLEAGRFVVGFLLSNVSYILGRGVTLANYAKIIGSNKAGFYMGIMMATGALSRIACPFWAIETLHIGPRFTFGITAGLYLVAVVLLLAFPKFMRPHWSYLIEKHEKKQRGTAVDRNRSLSNAAFSVMNYDMVALPNAPSSRVRTPIA